MRLARFAHAQRVGWGRLEDDEIAVLSDADDGVGRLLAADGEAPAARASSGSRRVALADVRLLTPLAAPSKVVCIGLNYRDHAAEANLPLPAAPMIFAKLPSAIIGPDDVIELPEQSDQIDWEVELAIVIGRAARRVDEAHALEHVAGYTVANDVSARDLQAADGQFVRAKSFDTFCPLGPVIATSDELGAADDLRITLDVDGRRMQDSSTSQMVFGVRELVAYCSAFATLLPGDVILTGTPAGTGHGMNPQTYLRSGQTVTASIEGIGSLRNPVR